MSAAACSETTCCPPDDFSYSAQDGTRCPVGYEWNGVECVPIDNSIFVVWGDEGEQTAWGDGAAWGEKVQ